ncbi:hypothetical protein Barb6_01325 [Bacteroidales bacterium Barb6]|nr:hypothetical protein Barb6XT_01090 [Bacteroidales bacterium Barb6XT]OAV71869.1 hypothetical protein Barb6_01325 [Bacteroidales bacterium Barb6]
MGKKKESRRLYGNKRNISDEVEKYKREFYSKYFGDLSKIVFSVLVVGNIFSVFIGTEDHSMYLVLELFGISGTAFLLSLGHKFIK